MNGWKSTAWKSNAWGTSWGALIQSAAKRINRIVKMPRRFIPFPLFKR